MTYYTHETELYARSYDAMNRATKCTNLRDLAVFWKKTDERGISKMRPGGF